MISRASFEYIQGVLADRAGSRIEKGCEYLLESRLLPAAREYKVGSVNELLRMMQDGLIPNADQVLVEALTDKETSFFRDVRVFETLKRNILPELISKRSAERKLSAWSIGCSTGQEAYSFALLLRENFPQLESWQVDIAASDISQDALRVAMTGRYNQLEINRGLPVALLVKYFQRDGLSWRLREDVGKSVGFFQMNVLEDWSSENEFDLVFLRNVIGGFATETQAEIFGKVRTSIRSDGCLLLGAKETLPSAQTYFEQMTFDKSICYRPKPAPPRQQAPAQSQSQSTPGEAEPPQGPSWSRLAKLTTGRESLNLRAIAEIFTRDPDLMSRLLKAVNRKLGRQPVSTNTLDGALKQASKELLLALAMATPAAKALNEVFEAMTSAGVEPVEASSHEPSGSSLTFATATFAGAFSGTLIIRLDSAVAEGLAKQALGLESDDVGPDVLKGMIGEMVTIIGGNLSAALTSAQVECSLAGVEAIEKDRAHPDVPPKAGHEPLAFRHQDQMLWVDIIVTRAGA